MVWIIFLVTVNRSRPLLTEYIEAIVMFLNRAVVLECPHLDVPWFRDRASRVFLSKGLFSEIVFFAASKLTESVFKVHLSAVIPCRLVLTGNYNGSQKMCHPLLTISSSNLNQFSNFFHCCKAS